IGDFFLSFQLGDNQIYRPTSEAIIKAADTSNRVGPDGNRPTARPLNTPTRVGLRLSWSKIAWLQSIKPMAVGRWTMGTAVCLLSGIDRVLDEDREPVGGKSNRTACSLARPYEPAGGPVGLSLLQVDGNVIVPGLDGHRSSQLDRVDMSPRYL